MNSPRLVLIEWEDSHGDGAWHQRDSGIEDRACPEEIRRVPEIHYYTLPCLPWSDT